MNRLSCKRRSLKIKARPRQHPARHIARRIVRHSREPLDRIGHAPGRRLKGGVIPGGGVGDPLSPRRQRPPPGPFFSVFARRMPPESAPLRAIDRGFRWGSSALRVSYHPSQVYGNALTRWHVGGHSQTVETVLVREAARPLPPCRRAGAGYAACFSVNRSSGFMPRFLALARTASCKAELRASRRRNLVSSSSSRVEGAIARTSVRRFFFIKTAM